MGRLMEGLRMVYHAFRTFSGWEPIWILYVAAVIYLLFAGKKDARRIFIYPLLFLGLTVFNPLFAPLVERFGFTSRYPRMFWMLNYFVTTAYAAVDLAGRLPRRWMRGVAAALAAALILGIGHPVFRKGDTPDFSAAENEYFVYSDILRMGELIEQEGQTRPRILYDVYFEMVFRSYYPNVRSVISKTAAQRLSQMEEKNLRKWNQQWTTKTMARVVYYNDDKVPVERFRRALAKRKVSYVIVPKGWPSDEYIRGAGLREVGAGETYRLWAFEATDEELAWVAEH